MSTELPPSRGQAIAGIDRSTQAEASSAHARLNVPLNLENWKHLEPEVQEQLLWFHQHCLDAGLSWKQAGEAMNYDQTTVFKVLKGTYEGSWKNVAEEIRGYRKIVGIRGTIQRQAFVENGLTRRVFTGLDYALANNSITVIVGESRSGKSIAAMEWRNRTNHGRSVLVTAPAYGGTKALLRDIAKATGCNANANAVQMHAAILRAFNENRILIVDEAHRLLPGDRRTNPVNLEVLRDIHDRTHCGLALIATERFEQALETSRYMYEQLNGRIGMPVRLPAKIAQRDIDGIVKQYFPRPTKDLMDACEQMANQPGRLGIMVETLRVASRIAGKASRRPVEDDLFKALALRRAMSAKTTEEN